MNEGDKRAMTKRERLDSVIAGKYPDRPPVLGGWIANPGMLLQITGESAGAYYEDPVKVAVKAYQILEMDGVISIFITSSVDVYRCVDHQSYIKADKGVTFEEAELMVESLPFFTFVTINDRNLILFCGVSKRPDPFFRITKCRHRQKNRVGTGCLLKMHDATLFLSRKISC